MPLPDNALYRVTMLVCALCIQGLGDECHEPGCAFWLSHPPDIAHYTIERMESLPRCPALEAAADEALLGLASTSELLEEFEAQRSTSATPRPPSSSSIGRSSSDKGLL
jgi:hypothetical protein